MAATFTPISRTEMEEFLGIPNPGEDHKVYPAGYCGFKPVRVERTVELVYSKRVDPEPGRQLALRVFTGINPSGESRDVGEDAIRVNLWARDDEGRVVMVGGSKRCHRVKGWRTNLQKRIDGWEEQLGPSCPKCGRMMAEREGKSGKFWGCPGYKKDDENSCNGTLPYSAKGSPECPSCEGPMAKRNGAKGEFWGCCDYPNCRGTRNLDGEDTSAPVQAGKVQAPKTAPVAVEGDPAVDCPLCANPMRVRRGPNGEFLGCIRYPDCRGTRDMGGKDTTAGRVQAGKVQAPRTEPVHPPCPKCESPMRLRNGAKGQFLGCTRYPDCNGTRDLGQVQAGRVQAPREPQAPECPSCGAAMRLRNGPKGQFYGCTRYSDGCRGTRELDGRDTTAGRVQAPRPQAARTAPVQAPRPAPAPAKQAAPAPKEEKGPKCPRCSGFLVLTKGHRSDYWSCCNAPRCNFMAAAE